MDKQVLKQIRILNSKVSKNRKELDRLKKLTGVNNAAERAVLNAKTIDLENRLYELRRKA